MNWREDLRRIEEQLQDQEDLHLQAVLRNLLTAVEVADLLGYSSVNSFNNRTRRISLGFPDPVKRFGRLDVWWLPDIEDWVRQKNTRVQHREFSADDETG